jgi:hypothetical protein
MAVRAGDRRFVRQDQTMMLVWLPVFVLLASVGRPAQEPEPLPCTRWAGTVSGNDPSVAVTATLCDAGDHRVRGKLVWQSKLSGSNTRTVEGTWSKGMLSLRDTELTGKPNRGWRFCKVDRYALAVSDADHLAGSYRSSACSDEATITLSRVR